MKFRVRKHDYYSKIKELLKVKGGRFFKFLFVMGNRSGSPSKPRSASLSDDEIQLLEKCTHFNRPQIADFYSSFMQECPSGQLTKRVFNKMYMESQPLVEDADKRSKYCEYVFNAFDTSSTGYISFSEFLCAISVTSFGNMKEKCELAFKILDLNKDNKIDRNEMLKVFTCLYDMTGVPANERKDENSPKARVDVIMEKLDANKDNYLSFDEFIDGTINDESIHRVLIDPLFYCKIDL